MTDTQYAPPVDKLLTYGEAERTETDQWPDYLALGIGPEHIPELMRLAADPELNEADSESLEVWAPLHAVRALGQLHAESVIPSLLTLLDQLSGDEWMVQEIPEAIGVIGPAAIPIVSAYLADSSHGLYQHAAAAQALVEISTRHPEARADCIAALMKHLEAYEQNDETLNSFIIADLAGLKALEALPLIERVFTADLVDAMVISLDDVYVEMGLKEREERPPLSLEEVLSQFSKSLASKDEPSDFEIIGHGFPDDENAPIVDSLPVKASWPVREFRPIKFSRNKAKKKKKRR
jgi:hypothetical protein